MSDSEYTIEQLNKVWDAVVDYSKWRTEPLHERDCPACDLASEIAGSFAAELSGPEDSLDDWNLIKADRGLPGDTKLDQMTRLAAWVLHRKLVTPLRGKV